MLVARLWRRRIVRTRTNYRQIPRTDFIATCRNSYCGQSFYPFKGLSNASQVLRQMSWSSYRRAGGRRPGIQRLGRHRRYQPDRRRDRGRGHSGTKHTDGAGIARGINWFPGCCANSGDITRCQLGQTSGVASAIAAPCGLRPLWPTDSIRSVAAIVRTAGCGARSLCQPKWAGSRSCRASRR